MCSWICQLWGALRFHIDACVVGIALTSPRHGLVNRDYRQQHPFTRSGLDSPSPSDLRLKGVSRSPSWKSAMSTESCTSPPFTSAGSFPHCDCPRSVRCRCDTLLEARSLMMLTGVWETHFWALQSGKLESIPGYDPRVDIHAVICIMKRSIWRSPSLQADTTRNAIAPGSVFCRPISRVEEFACDWEMLHSRVGSVLLAQTVSLRRRMGLLLRIPRSDAPKTQKGSFWSSIGQLGVKFRGIFAFNRLGTAFTVGSRKVLRSSPCRFSWIATDYVDLFFLMLPFRFLVFQSSYSSIFAMDTHSIE